MRISRILLSACVLPMLISVPTVSSAAQRERKQDKREQQHARPAPAERQQRSQAQPRAQQQRQRAEAPRARPQAAPQQRAQPRRENVQPRRENVQPRRENIQPRRENVQPRRENVQPRPAPQARAFDQRRAVGTGGARAVPRPEYRGRAYVEPRSYGYARPRFAVPVVTYPRRYYSFRPHFFIGFGLYLGYPVAYPYDFGYPTYVYGAPAGYQIVQGSYGGVSFDVTPDTASVIVDGTFVGTARDFGPVRQPLTLMPGRHHIELQDANSEPLAFNVDVVSGEVVPFRGTLQPY
ncbi:MAG TPA: hypothetical protein VEU08_22780 [Vicinamibacterales bacterium]|nr:hypothetical protein [Vicinamibacterales bacterium]